MHIKQFWNKAIEHYCTSKKKEGDYIFVSIKEGLLEKICSDYLEKIGNDDRIFIENKINKNIINSYYLAVQDVHMFLDYPALHPYLRFSIFTISRFLEKDNIFSGYWANFDKFLKSKNITPISQNYRTRYVQSVKNNLEKSCRITGFIFYSINIYGSDSIKKNVGLIYAHALFNSEDIINIKRSIYECGLAYENSLKYLTEVQIKDILDKSRIQRIINLFNLDLLSKELIRECLQIWLEHWEPFEKEEIELTNSNKTRSTHSYINLNWIWILEDAINNRVIKKQAGFILRNSLGNDGIINVGSYAKIDLSKGYAINESEFLYFIDNYEGNGTLMSVDINKIFTPPPRYQLDNGFALRKVSSDNFEPLYFFQETRKNIPFWKDKIFLATIEDDIAGLVRTPRFKIEPNNFIYLYPIRDNFSYKDINFIKSDNSINIELMGVSAGIQGKKAYLAQFPVQVRLHNLYSGLFQIFNENNTIIDSFKIEDRIDKLSDTIDLQELDQGSYHIQVYNNSSYLTFQNNKQEIPLEIILDGRQDNRFDIAVPENLLEYTSTEYKNLKFEDNWTLLKNNGVLEKGIVDHQIFDFCFKKYSYWRIKYTKDKYFIYLLNGNLNEHFVSQVRTHQNSHYNLIFSDNWKNEFSYVIKFVSDSIYSISINPQLYISDRLLFDEVIRLHCIYFELSSFDPRLLDKYPDLNVGDKIYVITNYNYFSQLEKLIHTFSQNDFPFSKAINYAQD